uniref:Uncharacterized protein n=1 Tax=Romanomermis culicivorax TaxID=13658 RepID=A0A915JX05_ROMCU
MTLWRKWFSTIGNSMHADLTPKLSGVLRITLVGIVRWFVQRKRPDRFVVIIRFIMKYTTVNTTQACS